MITGFFSEHIPNDIDDFGDHVDADADDDDVCDVDDLIDDVTLGAASIGVCFLMQRFLESEQCVLKLASHKWSF